MNPMERLLADYGVVGVEASPTIAREAKDAYDALLQICRETQSLLRFAASQVDETMESCAEIPVTSAWELVEKIEAAIAKGEKSC